MNPTIDSRDGGERPQSYPFPTRLRDISISERPQERLYRFGPTALSDTELLALLLRKGGARQDILSLVNQLLTRLGGLNGLLSISAEELESLPGIGPVKASQLLAVRELSRRLLFLQKEVGMTFDQPGTVFRFFQSRVLGLEVEKFWILCLNRKNGLLRCAEISSGIVNCSLVHPREVFREAIRAGASAIIAVHNHPSGDPLPSTADVRVTRQLKSAAEIVDIGLLDHIIIGSIGGDPRKTGFYSFSEAGLC